MKFSDNLVVIYLWLTQFWGEVEIERKTLTLKRPTIEKKLESTELVIQRCRKQVVVSTQRKLNKPAKTTV